MTKSRTLRKAAAVALSLAMAFSVATVSTDASAAAKPSLKSSKVTVKVKKSKSVAIKNAKLVTKVTVKVKNSKVAAAKASKKAVKVTGKKAGKTKVVVTIKYKSGKKTKTLKKNITVTVVKAETNEDDVVVTEGKITLVDQSGLQTDGTGFIGDILRADIPQGLGTIDQILLFRDGNQLTTTSLQGRSTTFATTDTAIPGKYYAVAITTKGTTFKSNTIEIRDGEAQAVINSFAIEDDYTTGEEIVYAAADTKAVVTVELAKAYPGSFKIYKKNDTKFTNAIATVANNTTNFAVSASMPTANQVAKLGAGTGLAYATTTGVTTYKFRTPVGLTRGTEYVVAFDQDSIPTDDPASGTANAFATAATAPYVVAPASIAVTNVSTGNKPQVTFYDADKKVLSWFGYKNATTTTTLANVGIATAEIYKATSKTTDKKASGVSKNEAVTTGETVKGVWTATLNATSEAYWFAYVKSNAGIFDAKAIELTSEAAPLAQAAATDIKIAQNKTTATTATVSFTNLRAKGKLYILQGTGKNGAAAATTVDQSINDAIAKFDANDPTTYKGSPIDIDAGTLTKDVENAIDKVYTSAGTTANVDDRYKNVYGVVYIPEDEANYGKVTTQVPAAGISAANFGSNDAAPTGDGITNSGVVISQKLTKYALSGVLGSVYVTTSAAANMNGVAVTGAKKDFLGGSASATDNIIKYVDQFGEDIVAATSMGFTAPTWNFNKNKDATATGTSMSLTLNPNTTATAVVAPALPPSTNFTNLALTVAGTFTEGEKWEGVVTATGQTFTISAHYLTAKDIENMKKLDSATTATAGDLGFKITLA